MSGNNECLLLLRTKPLLEYRRNRAFLRQDSLLFNLSALCKSLSVLHVIKVFRILPLGTQNMYLFPLWCSTPCSPNQEGQLLVM